MSRSSRARKNRAKAKKRLAREAKNFSVNDGIVVAESKMPELTDTDKRYLIGFAVLAAVITAFYWWLGGRNLLVFPAVLCISVGARKYWAGPVRRFAEQDQQDRTGANSLS